MWVWGGWGRRGEIWVLFWGCFFFGPPTSCMKPSMDCWPMPWRFFVQGVTLFYYNNPISIKSSTNKIFPQKRHPFSLPFLSTVLMPGSCSSLVCCKICTVCHIPDFWQCFAGVRKIRSGGIVTIVLVDPPVAFASQSLTPSLSRLKIYFSPAQLFFKELSHTCADYVDCEVSRTHLDQVSSHLRARTFATKSTTRW